MSLEGVVLGILRTPSTGYEIKRAFDTVFRHIWSAELSQIYRTLKQLERDGCLKSAPQPSAKGPERRVYRLTAKGRKRLRAWLEDGPAQHDERYAHVAQLFFLGELGELDRTRTFLESLAGRFGQRLAALQAMESEWRSADPRYPDGLDLETFHTQLALQMGIERIGALLRWAQESLRRVQERQAKGG